MIAIDNKMPNYRGSRGHARFVLPSGQEVVLRADDSVVIAELKRRNIWRNVSPSVELRTNFIFTDKTNHPIVTCEDEELRRGRLMLVAAVGHVLWAGLQLLGIEPLEEM